MREPLASRLLFPLVERRFTYAEYARFLDRVSGRAVVPMRKLARGEGDLALRHDVDSRLDSALQVARLEHDRGFRATYFALHTAPYWDDPDLVGKLRNLQELGHEVGFHNDLVTLQRVRGIDAGAYLREALARLRDGGLEVVGVAAHGSPWCHRLGFHNNYVFRGWDEPVPGFPSTEVPEKLDPAEFGLEYEAYHVPHNVYFSDSSFVDGRRSHPADLRLEPGKRTIVLVHPCHWDAGVAAKVRRLAARLGDRASLQRQ
ncbi:MAG TPA: hypothetical protein VF101_03625 [Gaiellaceae bacterium]